MSAGKMKVTIVAIVNIEDLESYEATSLEEAAKNQQRWIDEGMCDPTDFVQGEQCTITCEVAK